MFTTMERNVVLVAKLATISRAAFKAAPCIIFLPFAITTRRADTAAL
jgi:hypothetical protein